MGSEHMLDGRFCRALEWLTNRPLMIRLAIVDLRVPVERDHGFRWKMITQSGWKMITDDPGRS